MLVMGTATPPAAVVTAIVLPLMTELEKVYDVPAELVSVSEVICAAVRLLVMNASN
jgi:hypothetical protein